MLINMNVFLLNFYNFEYQGILKIFIMKYFLALIIFFHAILHLGGFIIAYFETDLFKGVLNISKPLGLLWLLAFFLFVKVSRNLLKRKKWLYITIIAVGLSQFLIIKEWQETKFVTLLNLIILIVAILDANKKRAYKPRAQSK